MKLPKRAEWYYSRLKAMGPAEIAYRLSQAARKPLRRLRAGQLRSGGHGPTPLFLPAPVRFFDICLEPGGEPLDWWKDYKSARRAPARFYAQINYRDPGQVGDIKYIWELNRHQFLLPWALDYARTGNEQLAQAVGAVISNWIDANPRYLGVNWSSSLELALRILSWGIACDLCQKSPHLAPLRPRIAASAAEQAHFIRGTLSLYSSANNHLMGELVGLLGAAAFFPEIPRSAALAAFARKALERETLRQNFADGVNREQALYYHHYTLEYVLTALALAERLGQPLDESVRERALRMVEFVDAMVDDTGQGFEIGDSDEGFVTGLNLQSGCGVYESLLWSGWRLFGQERFGAHAARIARWRGAHPTPDPRTAYWHGEAPAEGLDSLSAPARRRWIFGDGGYFIERAGEVRVLFKGGPFGYPSIAAHAHCDQLSVCLQIAHHEILTDSGTYCYHTHDEWRRYFRGTSAHNTVRIDGRDQADYGGAFLWTTHADASLCLLEQSQTKTAVRASHSGYERLADPLRHERTLTFDHDGKKSFCLLVRDTLTSARPHRVELFWNFGPDVALLAEASQEDDATPWLRRWQIAVAGKPVLRLSVACAQGALDAQTGEGFFSRRFLEKVPLSQLCLRSEAAALRMVSCFSTLDREVESASMLLEGMLD